MRASPISASSKVMRGSDTDGVAADRAPTRLRTDPGCRRLVEGAGDEGDRGAVGAVSMVRVLVGDRASARQRVCLALAQHVEICAEAETGASAVAAACLAQPEVCLIGGLIEGGAIEAVREISRSVPQTSIVVLSDRSDGSDLLSAVLAGAVGYVPAGFSAGQLPRVVGSVVAGEVAVPRSMVRQLIVALRDHDRVTEDGITVREAEILGILPRDSNAMDLPAGSA